MTFHALVVDDNPDILDDVHDRLESLGHTCDLAGSQAEAKVLLAENRYAYVLLDLKIPVKSGRPSRVTNGENLLGIIRQTKGFEDIPIIVMTSQGHYDPRLAVKVIRNYSAQDFVMKPFPENDRTLEKAIRDALRYNGYGHNALKSQNELARNLEPPRPFVRGELTFYPSRVELCGVKVCGGEGSCMIRRILDILRSTNDRGRRRSFCGDELAGLIGSEGGPQSVAGAIRNFRMRVKSAMLTEAKMIIDPSADVIINDRQNGYRFSEKIVVVDAHELTKKNQGKRNGNGPWGDGSQASWILAELKKTGRIRKCQIIERTGHSSSTVRRSLERLRENGQIVFEGYPRNGYWRLAQSD